VPRSQFRHYERYERIRRPDVLALDPDLWTDYQVDGLDAPDRDAYVILATALRTVTDRDGGGASRNSLHPHHRGAVMSAMSRRTLVLVPLLASACHTLRPVPLAPEVSRELPARSWVVLKGGERVRLDRGRVTADSVVGSQRDGGRFAVSRDSVAFVEERHVSAGRTLGLAGGVVGGAFLALAALLVAAGPGMPGY
jgi:hypothetical protein